MSEVGDDPFGLVGQRLAGRYLVEAAVAEGGFGVVYRGTHDTLQKAIAIKVLKVPDTLSEKLRGDFLESFAREARLIANLDHPAIVKVIDFGASPMPRGDVAPWMVLDWLTGRTLDADLDERREAGGRGRSPAEALELLRPVFEALAAAHELGVAHRDIKPANLMMVSGAAGRRGVPVVKLMDFGIAKVMSPDEGPSRGETQTSAAFIAYSPEYASPEQVSRMRSGPWTDVHAMALVLTAVLCDQKAYRYNDAMELQLAVLATRRPTPGALGVDVGAWEPVIAKALSLRPNERYQECGAFLTALEETLPRARRPSVEGFVVADTVKHVGPPSVPDVYARPSSPSSGTLPVGPPGASGTLPMSASERGSGVDTFSPSVNAAPERETPRAKRWPVVVGGLALGALLVVGGAVALRGSDDHRPAPASPRAAAQPPPAPRVAVPTPASAVAPATSPPAAPAAAPAIDHAAAPATAPVVAAPTPARAEPAEEGRSARGHRRSRHQRDRDRGLTAAPMVLGPSPSSGRIHAE